MPVPDRSARTVSMFIQILEMLGGQNRAEAKDAPDRLQVAVAALLVHAAGMDDQFSSAERGTIARLLAARFDLKSEAVDKLIAAAEQAVETSNQLYSFIRVVVDRLDEAERIRLIEMLWEVAYADGVLDPDEDALLRRVAGLVYVSDKDRGAARKRALQRMGIAQS